MSKTTLVETHIGLPQSGRTTWKEETEFVSKGRFKKDAMVSTDTGKRSTFVTVTPGPSTSVRLVVGCLRKDYDPKRGVCLRTTVYKKIKSIPKARAEQLKRKRGVRVRRNPSALPQGTRAVTKRQLKRFNPCVSKRKIAGANPVLAVISGNPKARVPASLKKAVRSYKKFHFTKPYNITDVTVPDSYPASMVNIGELERFDVQTPNGNIVRRDYTGKRPILYTDPKMKNLYIVGGKALGIPKGKALRCDYCVAKRSGRSKWSRRWWHAHNTFPTVTPDRGGRAVKVSGPKLKVTARGIEG